MPESGRSSGRATDQDGDDLPALQEFQLGTDPRSADTDGDGVADGAEVLAGSNPLDRTCVPRPALAQSPAPLVFVGCGRVLAPQPTNDHAKGTQRVLRGGGRRFMVPSRTEPGGNLQVAASCHGAPGDAAGTVLLTADGRQPLRILVRLVFGNAGVFLPMVVRSR